MTSFEEQKQKIEAAADAEKAALEAECQVLRARLKELETRKSQREKLAEAEILLAGVNATAKAREALFLGSKTAWKAYKAAAGTREAAVNFAAWLRGAAKQYEEATGSKFFGNSLGECLLNDANTPCWRGFTLSGLNTPGASRSVQYGIGALKACLNPSSSPALIAMAVQRIELEIDAAAAKPVPESERAGREEKWMAFISAEPSGQEFEQAQATVKAFAALRAKAEDSDRAFRERFSREK